MFWRLFGKMLLDRGEREKQSEGVRELRERVREGGGKGREREKRKAVGEGARGGGGEEEGKRERKETVVATVTPPLFIQTRILTF